jgi:arylamine N-acetyltransferase
MLQGSSPPTLSARLRRRVLERLGFSSPPSGDIRGLRALYRAWCTNVPFDNVSKLIALRTSPVCPLPGGDAESFFENWVSDGAGGTCWPTSNALCELALCLGFDAQRIVGNIRDVCNPDHASVTVTIAGANWLIDSSFLHNMPLPLGPRKTCYRDLSTSISASPASDGAFVIQVDLPHRATPIACRLDTKSVSDVLYVERYEASRAGSPFNEHLYARRNHVAGVIVIMGNTRFSKIGAGSFRSELSPEEVRRALWEEIGLSDRLIDAWMPYGGPNV